VLCVVPGRSGLPVLKMLRIWRYRLLQSISRDADNHAGLNGAEAARRLAEEGPNELPGRDSRNILSIAVEVLREPMLLMLLAACAIYLVLGDLHEALLIVGLATASIVITIVQELRSEQVLAALRDLTSPRALVIRGGERQRIAGREVVRGDILVLSEGDRIPADARLLTPQALSVDESLLTGESVPVGKSGAVESNPADATVYSGTLVVSGNGLGEVMATGPRSAIGLIGHSLHSIVSEAPPLQSQIRRFVRFFAIVGLSTSAIVALLYVWLRGDFLEGLLGGLALSMALLPEEFPVVLTVFLVMGAWRISRISVLTRRAAAIETLGSATILCTDKTGTLTENRMAIMEMCADGERWRRESEAKPTTALQQLLRYGILASQPNPADPMEKAFLLLGEETFDAAARGGATLEQLYPLSPELPAMTQVWREGTGARLVAAKGAPEAIARLCRLGEEEKRQMHEEAERMARHGLRVLAVASATWGDAPLPVEQTELPLVYLGLVGLADPLKSDVPAAVRECKEAGIRVVMITGDYPATARAIAEQAGIDGKDVITGAEIDALDDAALAARVRSATVFARVRPDQKLRIVTAFKADRHVVAMTGDGVNDAPSLKAAHIGIAMGGRGTDVAREASSIVLLKDDFASIVRTIRLGRRIYDNLQKAMTFVTAAHIPIAGLALLPLLFGLPLILLPVHIAFIEMIVDPVSSIAFEAERAERNVMRRPPRDIRSQLLSHAVLTKAVIQGIAALLFAGGICLFASFSGMAEAEMRSLSFVALVLANAAMIFSNRSFAISLSEAITRPNVTLWIVIGADALILGTIFVIPGLRDLFALAPLPLEVVGAVLGGAVLLLALLTYLNGMISRQVH
jgi:Ca2+-transporting ATPase